MPRRAKTAIHRLTDFEPDVAVVRCQDGDHEAFWALVAQYVIENESLADRVPEDRPDPAVWPEAEWLAFVQRHIAPPQWRWYRMNPDWSEEYAWMLGTPSKAGPGNWRGAMVRVLPIAEPTSPVDMLEVDRGE